VRDKRLSERWAMFVRTLLSNPTYLFELLLAFALLSWTCHGTSVWWLPGGASLGVVLPFVLPWAFANWQELVRGKVR